MNFNISEHEPPLVMHHHIGTIFYLGRAGYDLTPVSFLGFCWLVGLFVCQQYYTQTAGGIFTKLCGMMGHGKVGADTDREENLSLNLKGALILNLKGP